MNGNELYERIRMTFRQRFVQDYVSEPWHHLPYTVQSTWEAVAEQVASDKDKPALSLHHTLVDDDLMKWISQQPENILKRLYVLLHRLGHRI